MLNYACTIQHCKKLGRLLSGLIIIEVSYLVGQCYSHNDDSIIVVGLRMNTYLLTIRVSLEQEYAIRHLFDLNGWEFKRTEPIPESLHALYSRKDTSTVYSAMTDDRETASQTPRIGYQSTAIVNQPEECTCTCQQRAETFLTSSVRCLGYQHPNSSPALDTDKSQYIHSSNSGDIMVLPNAHIQNETELTAPPQVTSYTSLLEGSLHHYSGNVVHLNQGNESLKSDLSQRDKKQTESTEGLEQPSESADLSNLYAIPSMEASTNLQNSNDNDGCDALIGEMHYVNQRKGLHHVENILLSTDSTQSVSKSAVKSCYSNNSSDSTIEKSATHSIPEISSDVSKQDQLNTTSFSVDSALVNNPTCQCSAISKYTDQLPRPLFSVCHSSKKMLQSNHILTTTDDVLGSDCLSVCRRNTEDTLSSSPSSQQFMSSTPLVHPGTCASEKLTNNASVQQQSKSQHVLPPIQELTTKQFKAVQNTQQLPISYSCTSNIHQSMLDETSCTVSLLERETQTKTSGEQPVVTPISATLAIPSTGTCIRLSSLVPPQPQGVPISSLPQFILSPSMLQSQGTGTRGTMTKEQKVIKRQTWTEEVEEYLKEPQRTQVIHSSELCFQVESKFTKTNDGTVCKDCKRTFKIHDMYVDHKKRKQCQIVCEFCGKIYQSRRRSSYEMHLRSHKDSERLHHCDICAKKFVQASKLRKHLLLHTKDVHISCSMCCMKFHTRSALRYHKKSSHKDVTISTVRN